MRQPIKRSQTLKLPKFAYRNLSDAERALARRNFARLLDTCAKQYNDVTSRSSRSRV